ncbi:DNA polymerase/3'-5' exonuclease PolX [Roseiflexus castenholzii]|uniref:DNA polymerase/3'-5' exonuclease PolX n=1 Tax=Roseiflexus castenholzii TaxID=120962 RepID=UPI003C7AEC57
MTAYPTNHDIAEVFSAIADLMEILDEDRFRVQAYRRASDVIRHLPAPLATYRARGELEQIPGVGKAIAEKIGELLDTGELPYYNRLREKVPPGVRELLRVPGIGPRTAGRLYRELGITSLAELKVAAEAGRLAALKGFGAKTIDSILQGISAAERQERRMLLAHAIDSAEALINALCAAVPALRQAAYAGSLRRGRPTVGDLDILAAADDAPAVVRAFTMLPLVARVESAGDEKASILLHNGMQADLIAVPPGMWGSALQHFTGSKAHNIHFRELALAQGLSFSEHGFRCADGTLLTCATEEEVYAAIGLPWIPPELREDEGEFEAARAGTLPCLVELSDIRADLHLHSTWSDGRADIRTMAEAARTRGYSHIAITDHSAYMGLTHGLDAERLRAQRQEIAALNAEYAARGIPFRILHGVEVDITPEGNLALPDDVLAELDIVVASAHIQLRQSPEAATERLIRAVRNPHVDIIGHPVGRMLGSRDGAPVDIDALAYAAAKHRVLLEVNSGPHRLDLDGAAVRRALASGAVITINSDAHHPDNLAWMRFGVVTARRGWAGAAQVANTWSDEALQEWLSRR